MWGHIYNCNNLNRATSISTTPMVELHLMKEYFIYNSNHPYWAFLKWISFHEFWNWLFSLNDSLFIHFLTLSSKMKNFQGVYHFTGKFEFSVRFLTQLVRPKVNIEWSINVITENLSISNWDLFNRIYRHKIRFSFDKIIMQQPRKRLQSCVIVNPQTSIIQTQSCNRKLILAMFK